MNPMVRIFKDPEQLSLGAAEIFVEHAARAITERGRFLVALNGGGTPSRLFRLLVREPIDWTRVHVFWGDERLVPPEDPESSYGQAREALLKHVPIPSENVHRIASDLEPAAA
ncbi:MAG TPA: 6-phosphogluconolactonase, partial [Anaerolineales bacterium]|nr:6-phosphogluconolactonase [Anaerolineales bacterium]